MENKAHALAAGIFVLLLVALLLGMGAWLTRDTGVRDTYEISTRENVTGLQEQAPVRFRGVDVGKVTSVGFDPKTVGSVLLRLEVDRDAPVTRSTYAQLSYQGVTGLAFIQLSDDGTSTVRLQPDDERPPRIPLRPGMLAKLEERGEVILERVEQVTTRVNQLLAEPNQQRIAAALENIARAADSTQQLASRLDATIERRLDPALAQATTTLRSVQGTADEVTRTAADFGRTAQRLNAPGGPVDQLAAGVDSVSTAAERVSGSTLPRVNRAVDEASRTFRELNRTARAFTDNPQALIYGDGAARPGPGEPGFQTPGGAR